MVNPDDQPPLDRFRSLNDPYQKMDLQEVSPMKLGDIIQKYDAPKKVETERKFSMRNYNKSSSNDSFNSVTKIL